MSAPSDRPSTSDTPAPERSFDCTATHPVDDLDGCVWMAYFLYDGTPTRPDPGESPCS